LNWKICLSQFPQKILVLAFLLLTVAGLALLNLGRLFPAEDLSITTQQGASLLGFGFLIAAVSMFWLRQRIANQLGLFGADATHLLTTIWQRWKRWWQQESRWHQIALAVCILMGIMLRLQFLHQPIRTDEALTYLQFASKPLHLALSDYAAPNNHLLHTLLVFISTRLFGSMEWAIRLPAFLAGISVIPATYLAIRVLYNKHAALLAAALIATSPVMVEYSTNARGYTLQAFLFLLCLTLGQYLIYSRNRAAWGLFSLGAALGFYTIPTFLYAYGALMLWLLANIVLANSGENRVKQVQKLILSGIATLALTMMLFAPAILVSGVGAITGNIYVEPQPFSVFLQQLPASFMETWAKWHTDIPVWLVVALLLGAMFALLRQNAQHPVPFVLPVLVWCIPLLLIQRVIPFMRVWLYFLPVYFGLACAGLLALPLKLDTHKRIPAFTPFIAILLVLGGGWLVTQTQSPYWSTETGTFRDAELVTRYLRDELRLQPDEKVLYVHPSGESLMYYFGRYNVQLDHLERDYIEHLQFIVVLNIEYPQTIASVFGHSGIPASDYSFTLLKQFPLAEVYRAVRRINND
jgi:uncharacterized membrane protein